MKYLLLILSHFICTFAGAQFVDSAEMRKTYNDRLPQSTYQSGDLIWLISSDTSKIKVEKVKMDTIGPQLRIVSDTAHYHWNGVSAMWVYEVRIYNNKWIERGNNVTAEGSSTAMSFGEWAATPQHFAWLDSKKKPFTLKVWTNE